MVILVVNDYEQINVLGYQLEEAGISHIVRYNEQPCGITPPFLIVDGVPLDMGRASKWIKEHGKNG